jgi:hypothetical protein
MARAFRIRGAAVALLGLALVGARPLEARQADTTKVINVPTNDLLRPFRWRSIGPSGQGGRVDDFAVDPTDGRVFFVGFATGGLWKTTNNGVTFHPVFDTYDSHSIGDIAISPSNPKVVYVGTGEANNRQSSSFGAGLFKSADGGETFTYMGLRETQTIARIVVHPTDPDVVWVAAGGHLFGPNPERGVYRSSDGGRTWTQVLKVDENTGATDIVLDPSNPNTLFAATYQRRRTACCFVGGGPGSGIWRSDDGGDHWSRLTGHGLPEGTMGRISLNMTRANPDLVYAQIEVAANKAPKLSDDEKARWTRLARADSLPPDPQSSGIWRSTDKGRTWDFRSNEDGRPMYFSELRVSPQDPQLVYAVELEVHKSRDGGQTFQQLHGYGHVDQHAFWIDPVNDDHMMIGNDGSVDVTWDEGETWESLRLWAAGQSYHASVDMRRPYYVCTGLQDNGSWCGPSSVRTGDILAQDWYRVGGGDGFYSAVDASDYHVVYAESQNGNIRRVNLETGEQGSVRPRLPDGRGQGSNIVPAPPAGTELRWNWNSPYMISPHNPRTLLLGANRLFVSRDRGETWTMSPDLTRDVDRDKLTVMGVKYSLPRCDQTVRGVDCLLSRNDGVSSYGTIVSLTESPLVPGLYWVGTDDGNVQLSRDGGATWSEVGRNIPGGTRDWYVSRVEASYYDAGTAYASLDGHRSDDLAPHVFVTRDYGATWASISSDLPARGNVNTVRQDPVNPKILYAGTEFGFFISGNEGTSWVRFMPNLPVVRVDDVLVHPRDHDLVLSTHGRSVWVMDDVTALEAMTDSTLDADVHLFTPRDGVLWRNDVQRTRSVTGDKNWAGENAPEGSAIQYYLKNAATGPVKIEVADAVTGEVFRDLVGTGNRGMNRVQWDLRGNPRPGQGSGPGGGGFGGNRPPLAHPGVYRVTVTVNGHGYSATVNVLDDVWLNER